MKNKTLKDILINLDNDDIDVDTAYNLIVVLYNNNKNKTLRQNCEDFHDDCCSCEKYCEKE